MASIIINKNNYILLFFIINLLYVDKGAIKDKI